MMAMMVSLTSFDLYDTAAFTSGLSHTNYVGSCVKSAQAECSALSKSKKLNANFPNEANDAKKFASFALKGFDLLHRVYT
jgi:hypothetical protein